MEKYKILEKYDSDSRVYSFDFSLQPEQSGAADILSGTVTATPAGLTVGTPSVVGKTVQAQISSGKVGSSYVIRATGTTSTGVVMTVCGRLQILDPEKL